MTAPTPTNNTEAALTSCRKLFPPPPLLRNESLDDFKKVFAELFAAVGPEDFVMEERVYRLAIETRRSYRLMRYEVLVIERQEKDQRQRSVEEWKKDTLEPGLKDIREDDLDSPASDPQYRSAVTSAEEWVDREYWRQIDADPTDMHYIKAWRQDDGLLKEIRSLLDRKSVV